MNEWQLKMLSALSVGYLLAISWIHFCDLKWTPDLGPGA